ncbi:MAG: tagaturonate reductase [Arcticibacterium sp.]|jgi:tagaturonate reductase
MRLSEKTHTKQPANPEKILQFGTGVLLRGLCDFLIDKGNKEGNYNGSIVVVKSMPGSAKDFEEQDQLYTVCVRGLESGNIVSENVVCEAISRVISASDHWAEVLKTAENPEMDLVISNTTEVGLKYIKESGTAVPVSFPGKLTAWLEQRFNAGHKGVIIIPTELVVDNGKVLKELINQQIDGQGLSKEFKNWVNEKNHFCSSLVDRIVPGRPSKEEHESLNKELGYEDTLLVKSESYALWAIEGDSYIKETLSFEKSHPGVVIEKNITQYRELKLRMLNAPHTLMCGLCYLAGFETVKDALNNRMIEKYISNLMLTELAPALPKNIDSKLVQRYGQTILDRFRNPYLDHKWLSITFQSTMKLNMRAMPLLHRYYAIFNCVPHYFARGIAAYLLFTKAVRHVNGTYYGDNNGTEYVINDDQAGWYFEAWKNNDPKEVVQKALSNKDFWDTDLTELKGFEEAVAVHLSNMMMAGVKEVVSALNVFA